MTMTITEELVETRTTDEPGEAAHIVLLPPELRGATTPQAYIMQARVEGFEVEALCGHRWVPQKDPAPLPVCSGCLDIYQNDPFGHGDRGQLPDS